MGTMSMKRPLRAQRVAAVLVCAALSCTSGCHAFLNAPPKVRGSCSSDGLTALRATRKGAPSSKRTSSSRIRLNGVPENNVQEKNKNRKSQQARQKRTKNAGSSNTSRTLEENNVSNTNDRDTNNEVATLQRPSSLSTPSSVSSSKSSGKRRKAHLPQYYSRYAMLEHEILTAEEEQILGRRLQRSIKIKNELKLLVELRREELEETRAQLEDDRQRQIEEDEELQESLLMTGLYGGSRQDDHYNGEDGFEEDELSDLTVDLGEQKLENYERGRLEALVASSELDDDDGDENGDGVDAAWDDRIISDQLILDENLLSDHDIVHTLGVAGGRAELYQILIQGALARDKIIRSNIRLVVSIAKKWARQSTPPGTADSYRLANIYGGSSDRPSLDEAIQEGIIGLATAADKFEPERNFKFGTYATYWITSFVRRCFQTAVTGSLRVPPNYHVTKQKYQKIVKSYYETKGKSPPIEVIAEEMGLTPKRLQFVLKTAQPLISIDAPFSGGRGPSVGGKAGGDVIDDNSLVMTQTLACSEPQPGELVEFSLLRQCLENAMAAELSPHERDVLRLRLGLDDGVTRSVREVVELFGGTLSASDVRTAEVTAFRKLRSPYAVHTYQLFGYLDFVGVDAETSAATFR